MSIRFVLSFVGAICLAKVLLAAPVAPVAHYSFDDAANLYNDSSANALHSTGVALPGQSTTNVPFGAGSLDLNGSTQYIDLPAGFNSSLFPAGAATLSMWVRLNNGGAQQGSLTTLGASNSHYPWTNGNGYFGEFRTARVDNVPLGLSGADFQEWHHIAISTDPGDRWRLYIDGNQITDVAPTAFNIPGTTHIGRNNGNNFINGFIDEVQFFDVALNQTQIQNLISINATEPTPLTPEPASWALMATALVCGAAVWARKRRHQTV